MSAEEDKEYIILKSIRFGHVFITTNVKGQDPTKIANGETAYEIIGYADTIAQAQIKLYGRAFPLDRKD